jgi:hypothetical protein
MLESLGEVPMVDEAFYYAFCGGNKKAPPPSSLASPDSRKKFLESVG